MKARRHYTHHVVFGMAVILISLLMDLDMYHQPKIKQYVYTKMVSFSFLSNI